MEAILKLLEDELTSNLYPLGQSPTGRPERNTIPISYHYGLMKHSASLIHNDYRAQGRRGIFSAFDICK